MNRKLKIGFVGAGAMGQCAHLRNFASLPDCEVVALAELRPEMARQVAARHGVARVYPTHRELLAHEALDGIVAAQPFQRHGLLLPELLKAGVPLLTEAPLASSVPAGERRDIGQDVISSLRNIRFESGLGQSSPVARPAWLMVGYQRRCDPATQWVHGEIGRLRQTGELGPLRYLRVTMPPGDWVANGFNGMMTSDETVRALEHEPPPADMDAPMYRAYLGFVNGYIHQVNLIRHLLGEDWEIVSVDPTGVVLQGRSAGGLPCVLEMAPWTNSIDWQESALVCFERGWLRLDLAAPLAFNRAGSVELCYDPKGGTPERRRPQMPWEHAMRRQAIAFCQAIRGEIEPPCTAEEALKDLILARDYIRALQEAQAVTSGG
ncbi:MAG: 4-carboxy-2-hydroxymuconate-6-semialdehyde dehydrogenase [candidate division BRC1 bacterium ADurb.BinA292]|nr:MAG: 4-carboxy-2-hydroxymuconate-6-semialdehyde dehydrogenase [candidate division BRC1 bacterium ADurb.BinA292]